MRPSSFLLARVALTRRPMFWIGILAGLAAGGFILLCGLVILDGMRDADRQADQAAANMAEAIEHDTARTFEMFDLSLQGVIDAMKEPEISRLTGKARQMGLFDYAAKATYLNAILVLDETGEIVDDSRSLVPPEQNLADRDYFQVHRDNPDVGMYLSHPFQNRFLKGEWDIAISRRISKPDGSFGGVAVGILQLDYFQSLFANLSLGPEGVVDLFQSDGTLVARKPFQLMTVGRDRSNVDLFQHYPSATAGHFESTGDTGGIPRRFTFGQVQNLPLVVSVGFAIADIYAPWRQKALFIGALMTGFVFTILALTMLLSHEFARRKRADDLLRESEARYRLLADNSSDAIVLRTPDGPRKYATPAFYQMIGRSPEEMCDKHLVDFLHGESRDVRHDTLTRLRAGEQRVVELLQYIRPDGTLLWLETISSAVFDATGNMTEVVTNMRDVTRRKAAEDELAAAAATDGMTGLANRRSFDERLASEWKRASRSRSNIAILMIDVDCFKAYNDTFGHLQGDDALKLVATCIGSNIRRLGDLGARYGGEEFAVILPGADACGALCVAEKIRRAVSEQALAYPRSPMGALTISIGVASVQPKPGDDVLSLIRSADAALYQAKRNGRNRTEQSLPEVRHDLARLSA
jgi:diguanylate cyclase (GGDEF)-like protein/PAS domain S-box-containing protein